MARKRPDPKAKALRESRTLNPHPEEVTDEAFASSDFFDARDLVQVKYEMLRRVSVDDMTVSSAAKAFGLSRQAYYQAAAALGEAGLAGLLPGKPGPRGAHKLTAEVVGHLRELAASDPGLRSADLAEAAAQRFGIRVHPRSVERALARAREPGRSPKSR
jgi:transposase